MRRLSSALFVLLFVGLAGMLPSTARAQQSRVVDDDEWCDRNGWAYNSDSERYCEVREITLRANRDLVAIDGRQNGGIRVAGWDRDEILVRARVMAHARTESAAQRLAEDVEIRTDNTIYADTPEAGRKEWTSVSFQVFVPRRSNLSLETHNGGISIENVEGNVDFDALNGGVSLADLAGDVRGETTNGGVTVELSGSAWRGDGMDVRTTNGGVEIYVPDGYDAHLETGTVNGKLYFDFPVMLQGRLDRRISTDLGRGGQPIRIATTNGSVEIRRG